MGQSVLEMAKDIVEAQIQCGTLPLEKVQKALQEIYVGLMELKIKEEKGVFGVAPRGKTALKSMDWKKSIARQTVTCFECGKSFKQLTGRHLRKHGLEARSYRAKYGIPRTQGLVAKDMTARRKRIVLKVRPWENAPNYLKAHGKRAAGAKTVHGGQMKKKTVETAA